jgi:peptidoglycan hydrolase-like protein with peptidoglycan-binding domain
MRKLGTPDGIYGQETFDVVQTFQGDRGLVQNGIAGRLTVIELDRLLSLKTAAPPYIPPPEPVLPRTDHYELGTGDPVIVPDKGAGVWKSKPISAAYIALRAAIFDVLPPARVVIGEDAVKHMAHYFGNSGERYTVDLEGMIREVPSAREALEDEAAQAQEFVEMLPPGKHSIRSRTSEDGYNGKNENRNWFYATGGYQSWGEGEATIADTPQGRTYELAFRYKFFDRYNWDAEKFVTIFGIKITDDFMAEFHQQGLAREFDCVGSVRRRLSWKSRQGIASSQFDKTPDSRR